MTIRHELMRCKGAERGMLASLGIALFMLAGCSGGEDSTSSDEAASQNSTEAGATPMAMPVTPPASSAPSEGANEGGPNVIGLDDPVTPPSGDGAASGAEASQAGQLPAEATLVPDTEHCAAVQGWDPDWVEFEDEVLALVNDFRAQPADCGEEGQFQPAGPLSMDPILRCSARLQSLDMFERGFFDHVNPDGVDPFQRMSDAGFSGSYLGENIAQGQPTPEDVMADWMESDGHCANIMRPEFTLIGIGFDAGAQVRGGRSNFWTQNFGAPLMSRGGNRR
jgi:uncharacterized protein YkwD